MNGGVSEPFHKRHELDGATQRLRCRLKLEGRLSSRPFYCLATCRLYAASLFSHALGNRNLSAISLSSMSCLLHIGSAFPCEQKCQRENSGPPHFTHLLNRSLVLVLVQRKVHRLAQAIAQARNGELFNPVPWLLEDSAARRSVSNVVFGVVLRKTLPADFFGLEINIALSAFPTEGRWRRRQMLKRTQH